MPERSWVRSLLFWHRARHAFLLWVWRIVIVIFSLILIIVCINLIRRPSNDRYWAQDQEKIPNVEISSVGYETLYIIQNIRLTDYSLPDPVPIYFEKRIKESDIKSLWFILVPFDGIGAAHTFLSFELSDGTYLSVSVEARREVGEEYSPWLGLINEYELSFIMADERDVIGRRLVQDNDPVYVYPTTASAKVAQDIFANIIQRINKLDRWPEAYNTVTNNCTTNLAASVNAALGDGTIPWNINLILPKNADVYAQNLGLLDVEHDVEEERPRYLINEYARPLLRLPDFSSVFRQNLLDRVENGIN